MGNITMDKQKIIMHFNLPPSDEDLEVLACAIMESMPDELARFCEEIAIKVEELPDEALEQELDLEDSFDLLALYRSGKEISPGVISKVASNDDILILFRRPILDMWCETCDPLAIVLRDVMIAELGRHFDFSEDEIDDMARRHHQGML